MMPQSQQLVDVGFIGSDFDINLSSGTEVMATSGKAFCDKQGKCKCKKGCALTLYVPNELALNNFSIDYQLV